LALAVPLSRFTSQVGGGSAFFVRWQMRTVILFSAILTCILLGCQTRNTTHDLAAKDPYAPKLRFADTGFAGEPGVSYRFTEDQLARMASSKLETNRLVVYLEHRWPIERLQAYCVPTNRFPEGYQNLVTEHRVIETDLYKARADGFDRIWVYVDQDDGHATYFEGAGTDWHRWTYSLNVERDESHWVIIESLPNDFMDSHRYDPSFPSPR
jgi:hypothetical protein